jgi:hypothetical protein
MINNDFGVKPSNWCYNCYNCINFWYQFPEHTSGGKTPPPMVFHKAHLGTPIPVGILSQTSGSQPTRWETCTTRTGLWKPTTKGSGTPVSTGIDGEIFQISGGQAANPVIISPSPPVGHFPHPHKRCLLRSAGALISTSWALRPSLRGSHVSSSQLTILFTWATTSSARPVRSPCREHHQLLHMASAPSSTELRHLLRSVFYFTLQALMRKKLQHVVWMKGSRVLSLPCMVRENKWEMQYNWWIFICMFHLNI